MSTWSVRLLQFFYLISLSAMVSAEQAAAPEQAITVPLLSGAEGSAEQPATPEQTIAVPPTPSAEQNYAAAVEAQNRADLMTAISLFQRAADAGHAAAQASYAAILQRGQALEEAFGYYERSAIQGDKDGQYGLGTLYFAGEGVSQNFTEARKWFSQAAMQGHVSAINFMADIHLSDRMGLSAAERQSPATLQWIKRAADNNHLPALDALADAHRFGQFGMQVDTDQANEVAVRAAKIRGNALPSTKKRSALYRFFKGDN
ncbi:MAG: tetratricopeptide repeat protein [Candidatus Nitrotoga sp.]